MGVSLFNPDTAEPSAVVSPTAISSAASALGVHGYKDDSTRDRSLLADKTALIPAESDHKVS